MRQIDVEPDQIVAPDIDETPHPGELPRPHALRIAEAKRDVVADDAAAAGGFVLAADTVVACGRRTLPKAETEAEARTCLNLLSGRRHRVYAAVAVAAPDGRRVARVAMTQVRFKRLEARELQIYLASGEWHGKAGGYAIQGRAEAFVVAINGSYSGVVGLPLQLTVSILRGLGWHPPA